MNSMPELVCVHASPGEATTVRVSYRSMAYITMWFYASSCFSLGLCDRDGGKDGLSACVCVCACAGANAGVHYVPSAMPQSEISLVANNSKTRK